MGTVLALGLVYPTEHRLRSMVPGDFRRQRLLRKVGLPFPARSRVALSIQQGVLQPPREVSSSVGGLVFFIGGNY